MTNTLLSSPLVLEVLLPFLLVFTIVFAVLQKSQVFGEGKKQADAIIALAIGLIFVAFAHAVNIVIQLTAFLGVLLVIIVVIMILMGAVGKPGDFDNAFPQKFRTGIGIVSIIAVVGAVLYLTGLWDTIYPFILNNLNEPIVGTIILLGVILAAVLFLYKNSDSGK